MSEIKKFNSPLGELDYLLIDNGATKNLFMFHGYGANMRDLAGIAGISPEFKKFNWIFPNGNISVPIGPFMTGNAWFPIDMELLNKTMMEGGFEHLFADNIPEGLEETSELVTEFIHSFQSPYLLGGFSQGSMLSNYLTFEKGLKPEALLLLSSTLVAKVKWLDRLSHSDWGGPIFQTHGVDDPVLPISMARELKELFLAHHRNVDYHEFPGGHEIPPQILQALIQFLKDKS